MWAFVIVNAGQWCQGTLGLLKMIKVILIFQLNVGVSKHSPFTTSSVPEGKTFIFSHRLLFFLLRPLMCAFSKRGTMYYILPPLAFLSSQHSSNISILWPFCSSILMKALEANVDIVVLFYCSSVLTICFLSSVFLKYIPLVFRSPAGLSSNSSWFLLWRRLSNTQVGTLLLHRCTS